MYKIIGITPIEDCSIYRCVSRHLIEVIYTYPHIDVYVKSPQDYSGITKNKFPYYLLFKNGKLKNMGSANGINACKWIDDHI